MKGMKHYSPVLALALLAGCGGEAAPEAEATAPPEPEVVAQAAPVPADEPAPDAQARGQAAMREFGDRLRNELRAAMSEDGPAGAVSFCHDQAPRIADEVMATHGVRLGRVAVAGRNRNPGNAHGGWQGELLDSFQQAVDTGGAPEAQMAVIRDQVPAGVELRMARGIRVEAACLMCHGDNIAPPIAERLAALYPEDRATGFLEGDLRGLVWVEVPAATETNP
tara:strand:+ start:2710 stop:3378 length:669 start_codon:yes stop_codon:yes gene_type:complete